MWFKFDRKNMYKEHFNVELLFKVKRHGSEKIEHQVGVVHSNGLAIIGCRFYYDWGEVIEFCELAPLIE